MAAEARRRFQGASSIFYDGDLHEPVHMTERFTLDHPVDVQHMQAALDRTMEIYPFLRDAFEKIDGKTYYVPCDAPLKVFTGDSIAAPGPGKACGRTFTVTCSGSDVTVSGYHSTFDGGGLARLACTLLLQYCRIHFGGEYHIPFIPDGPDGREHPEYGEDITMRPIGDVPENHGERPRGGTFPLPEMSPDENGRLMFAKIHAPSEAFMNACHALGATPAILLFLLMAKAAYRAHPEQDGPLTAMLTVDIRRTIRSLSLGPVSSAIYLSVTRKDLEDANLAATAAECRRVMGTQRTEEYILSGLSEIQKTGFQSGVPFSFISTYIGHLELGDCAGHVVDLTGYNCTTQTINLLDFNGYFRFQVLLGRGTKAYSESICEDLRRLGVDASVVMEAAPLPQEDRGENTKEG